jgi:hypothetical protein
MGERIRKFFLTAAIGNEYGCSPLNTTEYSQPIIPEQLIHTLELYDISNLLGVDCRLMLHALEEDYICIRASSIAFASVLVAMDILYFPHHAYERFFSLPVYRVSLQGGNHEDIQTFASAF